MDDALGFGDAADGRSVAVVAVATVFVNVVTSDGLVSVYWRLRSG